MTNNRRKNNIIPDVKENLLPPGYSLLPGIDRIYELELAIAELNSLSKDELLKRGAYFWKINGEPTYHYQLCAAEPARVNKYSSIRLRTFFQLYKFKTDYATHGLFPYKGKFHPQLVKAIINIMQLRDGDIVLDPMTGSGTTNIEASLMGLDSIGIDVSPFCVFMANVKVKALTINPHALVEFNTDPLEIFSYFHQDRKDLPAQLCKEPIVRDLLLLCYLDALGYARRRRKKSARELFPIVLKRYAYVIYTFGKVRNKLKLKFGSAFITQGDARNLIGIEDESVSGIVTSPPYSFAIDYAEDDRPQLEYMGYEVNDLKKMMIGLRGSTLKEKVVGYLSDIDKAISEISRVLIRGKYCVLVIGSNTIQLERALERLGMRLEDQLISSASKYHLKLLKRIKRPIEGMRNIMRTEDILFFKK